MADPQRPLAPAFAIREAREDDWPQIWPIIRDVITEQQTFAYDPAMSEDDARRGWLLAAPARVVVAVVDDLVLGTANMYANRPGPGSHVASGSLTVARQARGKGVGRALTTDMISWARRSVFAAIQFNAVVDTNTAAVLLYQTSGSSPLAQPQERSATPSWGPSASASCGWTCGIRPTPRTHPALRPYYYPTRQTGGIRSPASSAWTTSCGTTLVNSGSSGRSTTGVAASGLLEP